MVVSEAGRRRLAALPAVRRAREYRLYTADGRRILDFYQDGGHAILGHRAAHLGRYIKSDIERGLLAPLPSIQTERARRAVGALLPGGIVRFYAGFDRAMAAVSAAFGTTVSTGDLLDPVMGACPVPDGKAKEPGRKAAAIGPLVSLWRPFVPTDRFVIPLRGALFPVLPVPSFFPVVPVVYFGLDAVSGGATGCIDDDILPGATLAGVASAASALAAFVASRPEPCVLPLPGMQSVGPYRLVAAADYDRVFKAFLDAGVLLSPEPTIPSIVPGIMSDGESSRVIRLARDVLNG